MGAALAVGDGFLKALLGNWSWNGMFLFETGQGLTVISRTDTNGDFDAAGDRAWENPNGQAKVGTGVNFVCWNGGATTVSGSLGGCGGSSRVVGYVAQTPTPSSSTVRWGRSTASASWPAAVGTSTDPATSPRSTWLSTRRSHSAERASPPGSPDHQPHEHSELRPGERVGSLRQQSAATGFPGYVQPSSPQFLDETIFSGSLGQLPYQRVIQFEARFDF